MLKFFDKSRKRHLIERLLDETPSQVEKSVQRCSAGMLVTVEGFSPNEDTAGDAALGGATPTEEAAGPDASAAAPEGERAIAAMSDGECAVETNPDLIEQLGSPPKQASEVEAGTVPGDESCDRGAVPLVNQVKPASPGKDSLDNCVQNSPVSGGDSQKETIASL